MLHIFTAPLESHLYELLPRSAGRRMSAFSAWIDGSQTCDSLTAPLWFMFTSSFSVPEVQTGAKGRQLGGFGTKLFPVHRNYGGPPNQPITQH